MFHAKHTSYQILCFVEDYNNSSSQTRILYPKQMKIRYLTLCILTIISCSKSPLIQPIQVNSANGLLKDFIMYTIQKDSNYSDKSNYKVFQFDSLKFIAYFDISAIYKTKNPVNQYNINKLYGFSDNHTFHQFYSARFGWRWSGDSLRLFSYCYNTSVRSSIELCVIQINELDTCCITIKNGYYVFKVNGIQKGKIRRTATAGKPYGYMLYPYFGGSEPAPHTIKIYLKEIH